MGRPVEPLINRRHTIEVALGLIDAVGLEGFNLRRLARELKVNAASLYHHFENKEDILLSAARLATSEIRRPDPTAQVPQNGLDLLIESHVALRRALLLHPALVPLMQHREARDFGVEEMKTWYARLLDEGVPAGVILPILSALEAFTIGSVSHEVARSGKRIATSEPSSILAEAVSSTTLTYEDQFRLGCHGIVAALLPDGVCARV